MELDKVLAVFRGYNLFIREWGNGIIYPMCAAVVVILVVYFFRAYAENPRGWRHEKGIDTALMLLGLFLFEGMRAAAAWVPLNAVNDGRKLSTVVEDGVSMLFTFGVAGLVLILLRAIWLFAAPPPAAKWRTFGLSCLSAGAFLALVNVLT